MKSNHVHAQIIIFLTGGLMSIVNGQNTGSIPRAIEILQRSGFYGEMYKVGSQEIPLTLYRIINPLANPATLNKYPVLFGHGILFDSASMLGRSENARPRKPTLGHPTIKYGNDTDPSDDYSLALMLSNNNFDVFLFESRGTSNHGIQNQELRKKFWDFSLDEQALVDLPMFIDFVLEKTNSTKLAYVGYSESTFFFFALLATVPEYADKIVAAALMAPVAYVDHMEGLTIPILGPIAILTPDFMQQSFVPESVIDAIDQTLEYLCKYQGLTHVICTNLLDGVGGQGQGQHKKQFYDSFYKLTSIKSIKHFVQLILGRRFGMYDYGHEENLRLYNQIRAPSYDPGRIKSDRIIMVRGLSDFLSTERDQVHFMEELGVKPYADIVVPHYNHFDFIDGDKLIKHVNEPVLVKFYELMYKDGPNILKNSTYGSNQTHAERSTLSLPAVSKLVTSRPDNLDFFTKSVRIIHSLNNVNHLFNRFMTHTRN